MRRDEQRLIDGIDDWRRWWDERGERELRCVLMTAWDPVGTGDTPEDLADALVAWHEWSFVRRGRPSHEWIDHD